MFGGQDGGHGARIRIFKRERKNRKEMCFLETTQRPQRRELGHDQTKEKRDERDLDIPARSQGYQVRETASCVKL